MQDEISSNTFQSKSLNLMLPQIFQLVNLQEFSRLK